MRVDATDWAIAFGLIGAAVAADDDAEARAAVDGEAVDTIRVKPGDPSKRSLLFFRSSAAAKKIPTHITVELRDPNSVALQNVKIPLRSR